MNDIKLINNIKIMSYNIWFDNYCRIKRLFSLFNVIEKTNPDIVCLQEVLDFQYDTIKNRLNYKYSYPDKLSDKYGCVILSKYPIEKSVIINLPSNMKRNLTTIKIIIEGISFVIANVHFESEFNNYNTKKLEQFKYVSAILNKMYFDHSNVILCSDTNVTDVDEEYFLKCFDTFKDAWQENGSDVSKKFTYDYESNSNLQLRKIELKCRIDRILFKINNSINSINSINLTNFQLLTNSDNYSDNYSDNNSDNDSYIEPSDHHGIIATFDFIKN